MPGWLRLSKHLKTMRPHHDILIISMTNKPYNLLDGDVLTELKRVFEALHPKTTRAVILTSGIDHIWISHYDVQEIIDFGKIIPSSIPISPWIVQKALQAESWTAWMGLRTLTRKTFFAGLSHLNLYKEVTDLMRSKSQVFIAAINGRCFGGGCELALACDFRIMVDEPLENQVGLGQVESLIGLIPGGGGTQTLARTLGTAKALELCLDGSFISAKQALEYGIVNKLVPRDQLQDEAVAMALRLASRSPTAIALIKDAVHVGGSMPLAAGLLREQGNFAASSLVPETQAAMKAYVDNIESFLGDKGDLKVFEPFYQGKLYDFTPGAAADERRQAKTAAATKKSK
ncbi:ClpP/crotonase [Testicularia cyperi]|uniref:ClpP/crotonase n=1 Tax=Testicularia cyperi TaxID=1882483 RepID=A0A317XJ43_9BASI|nr:ClpP/crotonase [Testicularia cyperi]